MSNSDHLLSPGKYTIERASGEHKGFFLTVRDGDIVLDNKTSSIWRFGYWEETSVALFLGASPEMPEGKFISVGEHAMLVYHDIRPTSASAFHLESTTDSQDTFSVVFDNHSLKLYWTSEGDSKVCARLMAGEEHPKWKFSKCDV